MSSPPSSGRSVFPSPAASRRGAAVLVLLEALVLVGFAVAWIVSLVRGTAAYPQAVAGLAVFALLVAGLLWSCARGVLAAKAWTRAPVVTFQLLLGIMGAEWVRGDAPLLGILAVVVAVLVVVLVLRPGSVETRRPIAADEE